MEWCWNLMDPVLANEESLLRPMGRTLEYLESGPGYGGRCLYKRWGCPNKENVGAKVIKWAPLG